MKKKTKNMKKLLYSILAAVSLTACMSDPKEDIIPTPAPGNGDAELVLVLDTPAGFNSATRALTVAQESVINDVDILVFDDEDKLAGVYEGEDVNSSTVQPVEDGVSGRGSFKVTLPRTESGKKVTLMVLANLEMVPDNISIGDDYDYVITEFIGGDTASSYFYMWGEVDNVEIKPGSNIQSVKMVRSLARIDVGVGVPSQNAVTGDWTWNNKDEKGATILFNLENVWVIGRHRDHYIIPSRANRNPEKPTTLPNPYIFIFDRNPGHVLESGASGLQRQIYIPESDVIMNGTIGDANHEKRTAIVVGGSYNGGATTYYRLDFAKGGNLINILRNHLYQFNISGVTGPGFSTRAEAYASRSMNMTATVLNWNEADMGNIWFDGFDFLGIDKLKGVLGGKAGDKCVFNIKTSMDFEVKVGTTVLLSIP